MLLSVSLKVRVGSVPFLSDFVPLLRYSGGMPLVIEVGCTASFKAKRSPFTLRVRFDQGAIVSSATIESNQGDGWNLLMDTVEVKGSNVPLLRQVRHHAF